MKEIILIGGYTKKTSKGIYALPFDAKRKTLGAPQLFAEVSGPTYFAVDDANHLFSVASYDNLGGIGSFSFGKDLTTTPNNHFVKEGSPLCYVGVDCKKHFVFGANYHLGEITVYQNSSGTLSLLDCVKHKGKTGPHPNQDQPRLHYADLTPDGRLVACDLGLDTVTTYDISEDGKLSEVATYHSVPGTGSRHLTFHPTEPFAYLLGELNATIEILSYDKTSGHFERLHICSTLPKDYTNFNAGAAIRITSDGKFLYASNRGHDSLAIFQVLDNGANLHPLGHIPTYGKTPRDFHFSTNEQFLIVANQDSDNVTLFERDTQTGLLTLLQKDIPTPEGTCVLPLKLEEKTNT